MKKGILAGVISLLVALSFVVAGSIQSDASSTDKLTMSEMSKLKGGDLYYESSICVYKEKAYCKCGVYYAYLDCAAFSPPMQCILHVGQGSQQTCGYNGPDPELWYYCYDAFPYVCESF